MSKSNIYKICILPNKKICKELNLDSPIKQHVFGIPYISSLDKLINFVDKMDISKFSKDELEWYITVINNYTHLKKELQIYVTKYIRFKNLKNSTYSNRVLKKILDLIHNNKIYMTKILDEYSVPKEIYYEAKKYIDEAINLDIQKKYKKSQQKYHNGLKLLSKGISKNTKNNRKNKIKTRVKTYKKRLNQISIKLYYDKIIEIDQQIQVTRKNKALKILHYNKILKILNKIQKLSQSKKNVEKVNALVYEYKQKINSLHRL